MKGELGKSFLRRNQSFLTKLIAYLTRSQVSSFNVSAVGAAQPLGLSLFLGSVFTLSTSLAQTKPAILFFNEPTALGYSPSPSPSRFQNQNGRLLIHSSSFGNKGVLIHFQATHFRSLRVKMGIRTLTMGRSSSEHEAEDQCGSISQLVSRLRTAFRTVDFDLVEEKLVAREVKLKREIEKLIVENAVLEDKHQFDQLEKLKAEDQRNDANERYEKLLEEVKTGVHFEELRRKNDELEREKKGLEALLNRKYTEWEARISRLEAKMERFIDEQSRGSRNMEGTAENGGMIIDINYENCSLASCPVIDLENDLELHGNGGMAASAASPLSDHLHSKGSGDHETSGIRKLSTGATVLIIDSDEDDCAPAETTLLKMTSGKPVDNNYLSMTSVEQNKKWLKRKQAPSLRTSDHESGGHNFELENTSIGEMTPRLKSSLEPSASLVNHFALNEPKNCDLDILTDEKMLAQQRLQEFCRSRSLAEANADCDRADSSSSSSSSDSEDGNGCLFSPSVADALEKVRATQECAP